MWRFFCQSARNINFSYSYSIVHRVSFWEKAHFPLKVQFDYLHDSENGILGLVRPGAHEILLWMISLNTYGKCVFSGKTEVSCSKFVAADTNNTLSPMDQLLFQNSKPLTYVKIKGFGRNISPPWYSLPWLAISCSSRKACPNKFLFHLSSKKDFVHIKSKRSYKCFLIAVKLIRNVFFWSNPLIFLGVSQGCHMIHISGLI